MAKEASIELQKLTEIQKEKKDDLDKRIGERKRLTDMEPETRKLEALVVGGEKEVEDARGKADAVEAVYKKYRQEILLLEREYESSKTLNKTLE